MLRLGDYNTLRIKKRTEYGLYLDGGDEGNILLPNRYVTRDMHIGDELEVFIYLDQDERTIATTEHPIAKVGEFAYLECAWTNEYGAFLKWGLMKDLFCPFKEQKMRMIQGKKYLIYCYIDRITYRIVASAKLEKFLSKERPPYQSGDSVEAIIQQKTDLGMKAIVDQRYSGLIFQNEIFQPLHTGDRVTAFVKQVREDGKIDLKLQKYFGKKRITDFSEQLLNYLQVQPDGFCPLHDKSDAEDIYNTFGVSKKTFKRGVGDLFKHHYITIEDNGVRLTDEGRAAGTDE